MLDDRQYLIRGLCEVYRIIVASAPLLEFAIPRCDGALLEYYERHLLEEQGHDEMLRDDLLRLGVVDIPHSHHAAQMAGSQYYLIAHEHPALLLGYMHALESGPLTVSQVDELSRIHGTELTALRHHAEHDPGHREDLEGMIAMQPEHLRELIEWNESWTRRLMVSA